MFALDVTRRSFLTLGNAGKTGVGLENKMKKNTQDAKARGAYGLLFFVSLAIPLFHYRALAPALWKIR